jgi:hypothetical protein
LPESFGHAKGWEDVLLVPSNELREHLLRRLAAKWEGSAAGSSIMTLYDFTVRLLKHRGFFPRELPPAQASAAMLAAVREVYGSGEGDFAAISSTAGFVPALSRTMADFEEGWLGDEVLREAEARAQGRDARARRWGEWRRLFRAVERKITAAGGMSRRRIFQEAVAGFEQPGYPFRVTLYGFYDFTRLQWTLVDALLASGLLDAVYFPAIFGEDGAISPAFAYAALTWERLLRAFEGNVEYLRDSPSPGVLALREKAFSPFPPDASGTFPFPVLSAPHEEGEIRLSARRVRQWQDSCPDEEILLVCRNFAETAVPAWERIAVEYGIRTAGRLAVPLASVSPVRVLLQMIEAAEEGFPRRKVIDVLSSPYRRQAGVVSGVAPRPDLWDVWSRELMVVSGDDWEKRLAGRGQRRTEEETEEGKAERREQMALLQGEVRSLRESLRPVREAGGYRDLAGAIRSLLLADFRMVADDTLEAERDRRAMAALLALLDDIERIPERVIPWPPAEGPLAWFRTLLSEHRLFLGDRGGMRIPGAVVAGDLFSLRGVTADRILFLSVNEDLVPAQIEEDPLLPDEDRAELNRISRQPGMPDALSLRRGNAAEEKLLFSLRAPGRCGWGCEKAVPVPASPYFAVCRTGCVFGGLGKGVCYPRPFPAALTLRRAFRPGAAQPAGNRASGMARRPPAGRRRAGNTLVSDCGDSGCVGRQGSGNLVVSGPVGRHTGPPGRDCLRPGRAVEVPLPLFSPVHGEAFTGRGTGGRAFPYPPGDGDHPP